MVKKKGLHATNRSRFTLRIIDSVLFAQVLLNGALAFAKLARRNSAAKSRVDCKMWNGESVNRKLDLPGIFALQR